MTSVSQNNEDLRRLLIRLDELRLPPEGVRPILEGPHSRRMPRLLDYHEEAYISELAARVLASATLTEADKDLARAVLDFLADSFAVERIWELRRVLDSAFADSESTQRVTSLTAPAAKLLPPEISRCRGFSCVDLCTVAHTALPFDCV